MKICADAGGTSIRIAYVDDYHKITMEKKYLIDSFPDNDKGFYSAIHKYLSDTKDVVPLNSIETMVVSAAGHVKNELVQFTNANWLLSTAEISKFFSSTMSPSLRAMLLNDFEALSYGLPTLENEDVETIFSKKGYGDIKIVCGPGTGLGLAALKQTDDQLIVIPSEGGHQSFPTETATEQEIIKDTQQDWVSYEHILSGQGLQRLFSFFSRKANSSYPDEHSPEEILKLYSLGNVVASQALEAFSYALGTFCGNMALALGATKGVYLWGGILRSFPNHLLKTHMMHRFHQRGRAASFVDSIPVYKICCEELPLRGCSIYASIQKNDR